MDKKLKAQIQFECIHTYIYILQVFNAAGTRYKYKNSN
jgi:hypothetical protein